MESGHNQEREDERLSAQSLNVQDLYDQLKRMESETIRTSERCDNHFGSIRDLYEKHTRVLAETLSTSDRCDKHFDLIENHDYQLKGIQRKIIEYGNINNALQDDLQQIRPKMKKNEQDTEKL